MGTVLTFWAGLVLAAASAGQEATYQVLGPAGPVGRAEMRVELPEDGRKVVRLSLTMESDGRRATVVQESTYLPDGTPERMLQDVRQGPSQSRTVVTFRADGAAASVTVDGRTERRTVALPAGPVRARNVFWFMPDPPVPGARETYFRFDLGRLEWARVTAQYVGRQQVDWNGTKVRAHFVLVGETRAYLDDRGMPYRVIDGPTTLERSPG